MLVGQLLISPEILKSGNVLSTVPPSAPWSGSLPSNLSAAGAETDTQPVDEPAETRGGTEQRMFGFLDYYERIHISSRSFDVGNLVSLQAQQFKVWNAYLVPKTLTSIDQTNNEGINLLQPSPAPLVYLPLKENTYTLQISTEGPATIDANYQFNFTDANDPTISVFGNRITAWTWLPDWSNPMLERLEWATDVMTAYDGTEQRIQLRGSPRRTFEFSFSASGQQRRRLDAAIYDWGARVWAVPVWPDGERLSTTRTAGSLTIPVTTANRDYHAGGLVMLLNEDGGYEVTEIDTISSTTLTLLRPLNNTWLAGSCMVYPVRSARLPQSHGFSRFTGDFAYGRVRMDAVDINEWPTANETLYRSYPPLTEKPNWTRDIDLTFERKLATLDFGTGERVVVDESDEPNIVSDFGWFLESRPRIAAFRSWLYSRAGKFRAFWVPSWIDDITVVSIIGAQASSIEVEHFNYTRHLVGSLHRKDIRIELKSGAVFYRRITGSEEVSATVERLSIDSALGQQVLPSDVALVSFMTLSRLDSDGVEINYFTGDSAQAAHPIRAIGHAI